MRDIQGNSDFDSGVDITLRELLYDEGVLAEVDYASKIFPMFYDVWHATIWTLTQRGSSTPKVARVFGTGFYIYVIQGTYDVPHTACIFSDYGDKIIIHGFMAEKEEETIANHLDLDGFSNQEWRDFFYRSKEGKC